jgi:hypothetical protein
MMKMRLGFFMAGLLLVLGAWQAYAVIAVSRPIEDLFRPARQLVVGRITAITSERRLVDVEVVESIRGSFPEPSLRIQVVQPDDLIQQLATGMPVVLIVTAREHAIHMGDRWLLAEALPGHAIPAYRVQSEAKLSQTFPGRTDSLVKLFGEMKTRPRRLLNSTEDNIFREIKPLGKIPVAAAQSLIAADFNGDKKPDLLVGAADGVRLFLHDNGAYRDGTAAAGLGGAGPGLVLAADVNGDGQPDIVAGGRLFINAGGRFTRAVDLNLPAPAEVLAAAIVDVSGTKRQDIAIIRRNGQLQILQNPAAPSQPWTPGPARQIWPAGEPAPIAAAFGPWDDDARAHLIVIRPNDVMRYSLASDGPAPADILRLTGDRMGVFDRDSLGLVGAHLATFDSNADGRPDLLAVNERFGLLLVNRGFGTFFASPVAARALHQHPDQPVPFELTPRTLIAAADFAGDGHQDLLVLMEDGTLYLADNPPHGR